METTRTIDELLEQSAWVRRLARSMVADASAADDLAQEAMLVALRRPPAAEVPLRAWLLGVLRNVAASWRRREQRRSAREERLAPEPVAASTDELAAQVEVERLLASEVLALAEPYRRTVLLRYFQGLSSAEIARQTGVPEGTVRWRLKRGLDQLREVMDARPGGRRAWIVALLPGLRGLPAGSALAPATPAPALLAHPWVLAAALLAVLTALGLWRAAPRRAPQPEGLAALAPAAEEAARRGDGARPAGADPGTARRPAASPSEATGTSRPVDVRARALDALGAPLVGARLALEGGPSAEAGLDGELSLTLAAAPGAPGAMLPLVLTADGHAALEVPARWRGEARLELGELRPSPSATVRGRVLGPAGRPLPEAELLLERLPPDPQLRERSLALRAYFGSQLPEDTERGPVGADGRFELRSAALGHVRLWARAPGLPAAWSPALALRPGEAIEAGVLHLRSPRPEELVRGEVVDAGGAPVPGALVEALRAELSAPLFRGHIAAFQTRADALGRFELLVNPKTPLRVGARDDEGRWHDAEPRPTRGGARELRLELRPRRTALLVARDERGQPVRGLTLQLFDEEGGQRLLGPLRGAADGDELRFDLPAAPFRLSVGAAGGDPRELGPLEPERIGERLEVVLPAPPARRLVVRHRGEPVPGARIAVHPLLEPGSWRAAESLCLGGAPLARLVEPAEIELPVDAQGVLPVERALPERFLVRVDLPAACGAGDATLFGPYLRAELEGEGELRLECPEPASLRGRVRTERAAAAAGVLVGVTNGGGRVLVTRADAQGAYAFERLAPGSWQVRALARDLAPEEELRALFDHGSLEAGEPPWDLALAPGEAAEHDVDLRDQARVWVAGRVLLGRRPPGPWLARLVLEERLADETRPPRRDEFEESWLDPEGRFRFELARPGRYRLELTHYEPSTPSARIEASLDVPRGGLTWSYERDSARLELQPPPGGQVPGARLTFVAEAPSGAVYFAAIERDGQGGALPLEVPAGAARLVPFPFERATRGSPTCMPLELAPDESARPVWDDAYLGR